jgi:YcaO-like protein with predicted kinase domain
MATFTGACRTRLPDESLRGASPSVRGVGVRIFDSSYSAGKRHRGGTHRTQGLEATFDAIAPRMGEFGITRLADVTGLDIIGVPVYAAVRPNSRGLSVSQGKGLDRLAAQVSALMEAIEGWHAERIQAPLRYESWAALRRSARAVDLTRLPLQPGARVEPTVPLVWIEGYDLLECARTWVPFECVMTNFVRPWHIAATFRAGSNGLASGNHLLEAVLHGLCELIERDACALWLAAGGSAVKERQLDLTTIESRSICTLLDQLRRADVEIAVWEITSDAGVPAFGCHIFDNPDRARWTLRGVFSGYGCHTNAEVALLRAITEAIQSRLTGIAGSRDDMFDYDTRGHPDDLRAVLRAVGDTPGTRSFSTCASIDEDTFEGDVEVLLAALRRIGISTAVIVDLTMPEIRIPVIKAVVPGLEPDASQGGYVPGARAQATAQAAQSRAAV